MLLTRLFSFLLIFCLETFAPRFAWPWHAWGNVISRTIFPFLILDRRIIHMHVIFHRRHIFMSKQLLQAKGIVALHQIVNGEGMTEDVRTDALADNASTLFEPFEE